MENLIQYVHHIRDIPARSAEYQEFLGRANDATFLGLMLELILEQQVPLLTRQLAISELNALNFHLNVDILDRFLPLLLDYSTQVLISKLLPFDQPEIIFKILIKLKEMIESNPQPVYCDAFIVILENVLNQMPIDLNIIIVLLPILSQAQYLQYPGSALSSFLKIFDCLFSNNEEEDQEPNLKMKDQMITFLMQLFTNLAEFFIQMDRNDANSFRKIANLLSKLLCFFSHKKLHDEQKSKIYEPLKVLLNYFHQLLPISPDDYQASIILYWIFDFLIWDPNLGITNLDISLIGDFLQTTEQEMVTYIENFDYFYAEFFEGNENDNEDENEDDPYDKVFSLYDWKSHIRTRLRLELNPASLNSLIQYLLHQSDSDATKFTILYLCSQNSTMLGLPEDFLSSLISSNNPFCLYFYCLHLIESIQIPENALPEKGSFPQNAFVDAFIGECLKSDNKALHLCAFQLIRNMIREWISPELYVVCFHKVLELLPCLSRSNADTFLYQDLNEFLELPESISSNSFNNPNNSDISCQLYLSRSIFSLPPHLYEAIVQNLNNGLFESIRNILFIFKDDNGLFSNLCQQIVGWILGGKINQILRFDRANRQISQRTIDENLLQCFQQGFQPLIEELISQNNSSAIDLFASVYVHVKSENALDFVKYIHEWYYNTILHNQKENFDLSPETTDRLLRTFIHFGLYEHMDEMVYNLLHNDRHHQIITAIVYPISVVIMNYPIYNPDRILEIMNILIGQLNNTSILPKVVLILARVLLHSKELFQNLIQTLHRKIENPVQRILSFITSKIGRQFVPSFQNELHRKLIISMYFAFGLNREVQIFSYLHLQAMMKNFNNSNPIGFPCSYIILVEEPIFYEDADFLSNDFIVCHTMQLIEQCITKIPCAQQVQDCLSKYLAQYTTTF